MTQQKTRRRRRLVLLTAVLLAAVTTTSCATGGSSGAAGKGGSKNSSKSPAADAAPLRLGQPTREAQELTRYGKTGEFAITAKKVVEGKPEDLRELGDESKFAGKKVAWVYVSAEHVGGDAVKGPMIMTNVGAQTSMGAATRLILIGDISARPKDCVDEDTEATWKKGDSRTACEPYLIPSGAKTTQVTYSQGYYKEPLEWTVG